jgi:glutaconate CoA-transferase subunit B
MSIAALTYTKDEMLVARAARELTGEAVVFVGIGHPNRAANLARRTHAPGVKLVYESGVYGAVPAKWPQSIGDPCLVVGALAVHSMADLFQFYLQRGLIDIGFLGAAQIDRFGNLNTTVVGPYAAPTTRLPGSGGACDIALLSKKLVVMIGQSLRTFPARLDFVTSPGHAPPDGFHPKLPVEEPRPMTVITDMAVFEVDPVRRELCVQSLHPGVTLDELRRHMGWEPLVLEYRGTTAQPTLEELSVIRQHAP